jgi:hypothetical protein
VVAANAWNASRGVLDAVGSAWLHSSFAMRIPRSVKCSIIACGLLFMLYVGAFIWRFELLGAPVLDDDHGWLGPARRGDTQLVDIGKVYYYEGADYSDYQVFRPLCILWLSVLGF